MEKSIINIALIGDVSVGKSTILNTILMNLYSDCNSKRCTMTPQSYLEDDTIISINDVNIIKQSNHDINESLKNTIITKETCIEKKYNIPIISNIDINRDLYKLKIYDIMGLNDRDNKKIYYDWTENNFYKFDIIILIITSLCKNEEKELLKFILNQIKCCKEKYDQTKILHCVINKCDYMFLNDDNEINFNNNEEKEYFEEIKNIYKEETNKYNNFGILFQPTPLCAKDSFIYQYILKTKKIDIEKQYITRIGENEFGKSSWYRFSIEEQQTKLNELLEKNIFENALINTGFKLFINNIKISIESFSSDIIKNNYKYKIKMCNDVNDNNYFEELDYIEIERNKLGITEDVLENAFNNIKNIFDNKKDYFDFFNIWKTYYQKIIYMKNKEFLISNMLKYLYNYIKNYENTNDLLEINNILELYKLFEQYYPITELFTNYIMNLMDDKINYKYLYNLFKNNNIKIIIGEQYYLNNIDKLFEHYLNIVIYVFNNYNKYINTDYQLIYHLEHLLMNNNYNNDTIKYLNYLHIIKLIVERKIFDKKDLKYTNKNYELPNIVKDKFKQFFN